MFVRTVISTLLWCCLVTAVAAQADRDHRNQNWQQDIDLLAEELPHRHKSLFFEMAKEDFEREVSRIKQRVSGSSDQQMQLELCRLLTSIGDGHTRVNISYADFQFVPLQFQQCKDGLFVKASVDQYAELIGGKLVSINNAPTKEIYERMATVIAHDNDSYLGQVVPFYMRTATMLDFVGISKSTEPIRIKVEIQGEPKIVEVPRLGLAAINEAKWESAKKGLALFEEQESKNYWTKWLPESKTLYLKYRRCQGMLGFTSLSVETIKFIEDNDIDRLVIDMRLNGGGNSAIMQPLLMALRSSKLNQKGKLYVVMGRKTFSSAVLNSIDFKQRTEAILVGLPTGGKPNHYGEVKNMTLPNSGLVITYSTNYFENFKGGDPLSLEPDVRIEPTFVEWCRGEDAVMNYILKQPVPDSK